MSMTKNLRVRTNPRDRGVDSTLKVHRNPQRNQYKEKIVVTDPITPQKYRSLSSVPVWVVSALRLPFAWPAMKS